MDLEGGGSPKGGVKGEVVGLAVGGTGLNIAAPLTLGDCETTFASLVARQFVDRGLQTFRYKTVANADSLGLIAFFVGLFAPLVRRLLVGCCLG